MTEKMCPCGEPLHYTNAIARQLVEKQVAELGECIKVTVAESDRTFVVPRHFIALHGIPGADLPAQAERYGFEEVE